MEAQISLKPMASFNKCKATVTVCNSRTKDLKKLTQFAADMVVIVVGVPYLLKEDMVKMEL